MEAMEGAMTSGDAQFVAAMPSSTGQRKRSRRKKRNLTRCQVHILIKRDGCSVCVYPSMLHMRMTRAGLLPCRQGGTTRIHVAAVVAPTTLHITVTL
jgi:hypothetical protein